MMIAINGDALHVASVECSPVLEGIEISWSAGYAPGSKDQSGVMRLSMHEAIQIAATVEDILDAIQHREEERPLDMIDEINHLSAQAKGGV